MMVLLKFGIVILRLDMEVIALSGNRFLLIISFVLLLVCHFKAYLI